MVDEQTRQLKDRDGEIQEIRDNEAQIWERKMHEMQQTMILNDTCRMSSQSTDLLIVEKMDLMSQVEDLRDKLAVEFNKKRKMRQEYEERVATLTEEVHYYKDVKCAEMSELLATCKMQLRDFEELNAKRNSVIERLESENRELKER